MLLHFSTSYVHVYIDVNERFCILKWLNRIDAIIVLWLFEGFGGRLFGLFLNSCLVPTAKKSRIIYYRLVLRDVFFMGNWIFFSSNFYHYYIIKKSVHFLFIIFTLKYVIIHVRTCTLLVWNCYSLIVFDAVIQKAGHITFFR